MLLKFVIYPTRRHNRFNGVFNDELQPKYYEHQNYQSGYRHSMIETNDERVVPDEGRSTVGAAEVCGCKRSDVDWRATVERPGVEEDCLLAVAHWAPILQRSSFRLSPIIRDFDACFAHGFSPLDEHKS